MDKKAMKGVMVKMTVLMGLTMSLVLSLVGSVLGMVHSGSFSVPGWFISFFISLIISLIIGFLIPVKKVTDSVCKKAGAEPASPKGNLLGALISDFIYTPVITVIMVMVNVNGARRSMPAEVLAEAVAQGRAPTVGRILPLSLIVCFIVGFIVIAVIQPVFLKMLTRNLKGPGRPGESNTNGK